MPNSDKTPERRRLDPKTGRELPDGIRYRADRDVYQIRVRVPDGLGGWREHTSTHKTAREATSARQKVVGGATQPASAMTLNRWKESYWDTAMSTVAPATRRAYRVGWEQRVQPTLGHRKLRDIDPAAVEMAIASWSGVASTKIDALSALSKLLEGARKKGLVAYNAAREATRPKIEELDPRSRALTPEEVELVLSLIPDGPYRRYAAALAYTGERPGEVTALRVRDTDIPGKVIRVHRNVSPGEHGELVEHAPKSHKWRPVPLIDLLVPHIEEAARGKKPSDRLFSGVRGGRLTSHTFIRAVDWQKIRDVLDRSDFVPYDLRHTFATLMFDAGVPAPDVQQAMGHSSLQVTERYSRSRDNAAARNAPKLNEFLVSKRKSGPVIDPESGASL